MTPSNTTQGAKRITPYMQAVLVLARFDLQYHRLMMAARAVVQSQRPQSDAQVRVPKTELDELAVVANESKPDWSKIEPDQPTAPASPSPVTEETKGEAIDADDLLHELRRGGYGHNVSWNDALAVLKEALTKAASPTPSPAAPAQQGELETLRATVEAYRKRARKLYTPDVAATKIAEDEARMRDVDKQLEIATAILRYFGLEVVNELGEGVKMLMTDEKNGVKQCAYVRVIPGGSYACDQSELKILREEFDKAQAAPSAAQQDKGWADRAAEEISEIDGICIAACPGDSDLTAKGVNQKQLAAIILRCAPLRRQGRGGAAEDKGQTPRTDAAQFRYEGHNFYFGDVVWADYARRLERELAMANAWAEANVLLKDAAWRRVKQIEATPPSATPETST